MRPARQRAQHGACVGLVDGLAEFFAVEGDDGVGCDDDFVGLGIMFADGCGFRSSEALDEREGCLVVIGRLVYIGGEYATVEARLAHELATTRRLRREDHSWIPSRTFSTATSPAMSLSTARANGSA